MEDSKLNTIQFAQSLFGLEPDTPIAQEFDREFGQTNERWWSCQREHFSQWAISQNTEGVEGYRHKPNTNSAKMYNSIGRPELLLWLIEALHISLDMDLSEFRRFVVELSKLGRKAKKQCSMIREKYPYVLEDENEGVSVEDLLLKHRKKWKIKG